MRIFVIAGRLIRQVAGDKRTLVLIMVAPVFILFILHVVLTSGVTKARMEVVNAAGCDTAALEQYADVTYVSAEDGALADLKAGKCDAYLVTGAERDKLMVDGSDPTLTALAKGAYSRFAADRAQREMQDKIGVLAGLLEKLPGNVRQMIPIPDLNAMMTPPEPEIGMLYAGDFDFFDTIASGIMCFIVFFLVFLLSGISFLRERIGGTLERMMASSVRRREIVAGYLIGFGLFVVIQTVLIQSFLIYALKIHYSSTFLAILAVNLISAATSLALGTLLSAFARNEFQLIQFIPIVIIPQVLFSGLFDLRDAPNWVHWLSQIFPLTYASDALTDMMIRGKSFADVWVDVAVLCGFTAVFIALNIIALKKYRRA
jgi:ABC-2 type transport system permease protein